MKQKYHSFPLQLAESRLPYISATKKDAAKKHLQIAITLLKKNAETRKAEYLEPLFTQTIEQTSELPVTVLNSKP